MKDFQLAGLYFKNSRYVKNEQEIDSMRIKSKFALRLKDFV